MPYGYDLFKYDVQITETMLTNVIKQIDAINTRDQNAIMLMHKPTDSTLVSNVLNYRNYKHLQNFYWHKINQLESGPTDKFINCVEMGTIGFWPNRTGFDWYGSADPSERHNFIECKSVTTLSKQVDGSPINVTEKPPDIVQHFLPKYCAKGHTVLVIGPGAGGEVIGAAMSGLNVIGAEIDRKMFDGLCGRLNKIVAEQKNEIAEAKALEAKQKAAGLKELSNLRDGSDEKIGELTVMCVECGDRMSKNETFMCDDCDNEDYHHRDCIYEFVDRSRSNNVSLCCGKCKDVRISKGENVLIAVPEGSEVV